MLSILFLSTHVFLSHPLAVQGAGSLSLLGDEDHAAPLPPLFGLPQLDRTLGPPLLRRADTPAGVLQDGGPGGSVVIEGAT